jgi:hypothetical protein
MSLDPQALAQRLQPAASAEAEAVAALLPRGKEAPLPSLLAAHSRGVGDDGSEVEANAGRTQPLPACYSRMWSPQTKASPLGGPDEARIHEGGGPGTADNDPYGWMHTCLARLLPESMQSSESIWSDEWIHTCLARLLPESMQSNEGIWNGTISALKAADVRSEEQLDAMSSEDLKKANVPLNVRALLLRIRKSRENLSPQAILFV